MDDLNLVQRCARQDKHAWNEFIEKYSRLIYNYIHSVLKTKGAGTAQNCPEDIFQELFASLIKDDFRKLKSYKAKNGCSLASWLRHVTVNFTIGYLRGIRPALSIDQGEGDVSLGNIISDGSIPAPQALINKEKISGLQECIDKLNNDDKYFLELYLNRGIKLERLKEHLKISRSAADMRRSRIIGRLKECFKSKGFALDF